MQDNKVQLDSQTISRDYVTSQAPALNKSWTFAVNNGNTGTLTVTDELLDTEALAQDRARAEMLVNSYSLREIDMQIARTDLWINDTFRFRGLDWIVKSVAIVSSNGEIYSRIKGVRYE